MCRNIKPLRLPDRPATEQEIQEAALQFVRTLAPHCVWCSAGEVSGTRKPSRANQPAFDAAVQEIAAATQKMLNTLSKEKVRT